MQFCPLSKSKIVLFASNYPSIFFFFFFREIIVDLSDKMLHIFLFKCVYERSVVFLFISSDSLLLNGRSCFRHIREVGIVDNQSGGNANGHCASPRVNHSAHGIQSCARQTFLVRDRIGAATRPRREN